MAELKRRRVFRALVGYGAVSFAVLQIIEPVVHGLHWPDAVLSYAVVALALGFPVVVGLAWIFDVNDGRIERTAAEPHPSMSRARIALVLGGIGALAAAPGLLYVFANRGGAKTAPKGELAAPSLASIAVLPFVNLSSDKEQEFFSEGIAEEILNALGRVPGLRVSGRASSFSFKGKTADLAEIGRKLNVGTVLEGSVRKDGKRVRVTAQMSEVAQGTHLWSESFDRELTGIFSVQEEIAAAVVAALRIKLLPGEAPSTRQYRTANPEVYNQYLLGHRFWGRESQDGFRRAIEAFEKAVSLEPDYAPGQAGLALALLFTANEQDRQRSLAAAEKAVKLAPDLAEAWAVRGKARSWANWDWEGGREDLERAVRLNPNDSMVQQHYAAVLASLGRLAEAIAAMRRSTELDPLRGNAWELLSLWYLMDGQLGPARSALTRGLELNPDSEALPHRQFQIFLLEGKPVEALATLQATHRRCLTCVAMAEHDLRHAAESQRAFDALLVEFAAQDPYSVAAAYAWRGERDQAFAWLDRAFSAHSFFLSFFKVDPFMRSLHGDPRFTALLKKLNLPVDPAGPASSR